MLSFSFFSRWRGRGHHHCYHYHYCCYFSFFFFSSFCSSFFCSSSFFSFLTFFSFFLSFCFYSRREVRRFPEIWSGGRGGGGGIFRWLMLSLSATYIRCNSCDRQYYCTWYTIILMRKRTSFWVEWSWFCWLFRPPFVLLCIEFKGLKVNMGKVMEASGWGIIRGRKQNRPLWLGLEEAVVEVVRKEKWIEMERYGVDKGRWWTCEKIIGSGSRWQKRERRNKDVMERYGEERKQ